MPDNRLVKKIYNEINLKWTGIGRACRKTWKRWVNGIVEEFYNQELFEKIEEFSKQQWKKIIKEAATQFELNSMKDKFGKCHKLELFRELERDLKIVMKPYVKRVVDDGKRLKVKFRSGTNALGQEMKRWGRGEGKCESCNMGVIEDVEHFVILCPKYERRNIFLKNLCCVNKKNRILMK